MFAVTLRLSNTVKKFPNPPTGLRMATKRSPSDSEAYAFDQSTFNGMDTAKAAPRHWMIA